MKQPSSRRQTPLPGARLVLVGGFLALHHLVIRGIALTLDQLGMVEVHHVWRYWTAALILIGLSGLQRSEGRRLVTPVMMNNGDPVGAVRYMDGNS